MEELKEKILKEGIALNDMVLKVDSFINHQVDSDLMKKIGEEFANYFRDKNITKVVTIESGGIVPGVFTAYSLGVPFVIFKKEPSKTLAEDFYQTKVKSFTKGIEYELTVSKKYIDKEDNILMIDDFLANGEAALGLTRIIEMSGAKLSGIGILIEKSFQGGRQKLIDKGYHPYSLARIKKLEKGKIEME